MVMEALTTCLVENKLFDSPHERKVFDVERMSYLLATYESAVFFQKYMRMSKNLISSVELLKYALSERMSTSGLNLEFGVATGKTLKIICESINEKVYGFDTFEGLPEDWTHFQKAGRFSSNGTPNFTPPNNAELIVGLFEESLPDFLNRNKTPTVNFVHIDSDLYSSAKCVLNLLTPRLVHGTIIVFDEYFNYPGWEHHEHKALNEFLNESKFQAEYIGFASSAQSVAVRLVTKNSIS